MTYTPNYLPTAVLEEFLKKINYKPGWRFQVYDGAHEGQHIVITTEVPDSYNPGETVTLDVHTSLPPMASLDYFCDWLLWRLKRIESHECREFFKVGEKVWSDPHGENADRDL